MNELVSLDGFPISGTTRDGKWRVTELSGWWGRPAPKSRGESRVNGDGDLDTPVLYGPRLITVGGRLVSSNHEYLHQAMGRINALGLRGGIKLAVSGHGPAQWAIAHPRDDTTAEFLTDKYLKFQIPLECADPFKYGASNSFSVALGSGVTVFQRGTVPAWPVVTVTGSAPGGYSVSLGGRLVRVTAPLVSGTPHKLDMRTGILRAGGSRVNSGIAEAEYFAVPPGSPSTFVTSINTTGSATVSISLNDTYI